MQQDSIQPLPAEEVQKICAGEVVERPLSVVKELIENALDAGATQVSVELEDGGKRLIRVSDNGRGIPADELVLALSPHCTSKIRGLDDLYQLHTLGFRGEALASIGAVAQLALSSRRGSATAMRIEAAGTAPGRPQPCNLQQGSEVEVRELFFNTPARRKFLRSSQSETAQVSGLLTTYAIAYPEVAWKLVSGGRTLLASDGDGDLRSVLADLLGPDFADSLAPVHFEYPPCAVSGYVSLPQKHWHNRTRQWYLVNRRPVQNKLLYKAVDDSLREFMSPGKFPAGVFRLELPPEEIDVNVHPMKSEVNFANSQQIYSLLTTALRRALGDAAAAHQRRLTRGMALLVKPAAEREPEPAASGAAPDLPLLGSPHVPPPESFEEYQQWSGDHPQLDPEAGPGQRAIPVFEIDKPFVPPAQPPAGTNGPGQAATGQPIEFPSQRLRPAPAPAPAQGAAQSPETELPPWGQTAPEPRPAALAAIQQVADTYLVLSTPGEVYLIDQHSAHERVLFEQLWEKLDPQKPGRHKRQRLLFPMLLTLSPAEAGALDELTRGLNALGFAAEAGAGRSLIISEVPALLASRLTQELLHAVIADLADPLAMPRVHLGWALADPVAATLLSPDSAAATLLSPDSAAAALLPPDSATVTPEAAPGFSSAFANRLKLLAATLACKAAVKAGQALSPAQRTALIREVLARWSSLTCPHGRPTVLRLGPGELERMFLRS